MQLTLASTIGITCVIARRALLLLYVLYMRYWPQPTVIFVSYAILSYPMRYWLGENM